MRHRNKNKSLSRTASHRKAMLSNMACSLIVHKRIKTTVAKAKVLKRYVEPIITKCKNDSTHSRRVVFSKLKDKKSVSELFSVISEKVSNRPGGYTRIIKLGKRLGDAAEICFIELVDFNEIYNSDKEDKKKTRRSRRSSKSSNNSENLDSKVKESKSVSTSSNNDTPAEEAPAEETPAEEAPTEEAPTEEAPAEEAPAEEVPAEEAPAEEAPTEEEGSTDEENKEEAEEK